MPVWQGRGCADLTGTHWRRTDAAKRAGSPWTACHGCCPRLVQMEASPGKLPPIPGRETLPTPADMDLQRRVTRFLNPEG